RRLFIEPAGHADGLLVEHRSKRPGLSRQRRDLDVADEPQLQRRIKIAHGLTIEINDAAGLERADIVDSDDGLPVVALDERESRPIVFAKAYAAKLSAQIGANRGGPVIGIVKLA